MRPRSVKKGAPGPGKRTPARAVKSTPKSQNRGEAQEEPRRQELVLNLEEKLDEKSPERYADAGGEQKGSFNGSLSAKEEEAMKEAFEEEDRGERLDLDDNEPEYEPEEDQVLEYDDREDEFGDAHQVGDEGDEVEGEVAEEEEEEGDMVDEEDLGDEEDAEEDENADEEEENEDAVEQDEHHEIAKERRKRKEFEVFIGGLEKETTEEDLKKVFYAVGEVVEVRLMMNLQTKKNKGFAFLRFASIEQAKRAVTELKNPVINGKQCGVSPSHDNDTLFLGNICKTWTKEALKEKLKHYGVTEYEDLTLVVDSNNEGMNRGFAFLEFASRSDAMDAFKRLQRRDVVFGVDRSAKVSFADSFIEPDDEVMAQVKTIFVDGIPASWDEDRVKEYLKKYGEIEKIELARNMPSAKRKDFGFVTFDTHDAAVACAEAINNSEFGEGSSKVKVRARLSRPHQKGRGKHFARGDHKVARGPSRLGRGSWSRAVPPRVLPSRLRRGTVPRSLPATSSRMRPVATRDRRPYVGPSDRVRFVPPPSRSYDRRPPVAPYPKSSLKREYGRREELPPPRSSRVAADYGPRIVDDRRPSYRDEYSSRAASYTDVAPRGSMRAPARRAYADEGYARRLERPNPSYRESRGREYVPMPGSKRPYSAMDEDPRYVDPRQSRARLDYGDDYSDAYPDRLGRSYGSRSSFSSHESLYGSRHGLSYGGSVSSSDVGSMYSSSYGSDYAPREHVGGSSYSSLYSSRSASSGGYLGSSGSGSYY